MFGFSFGEIVVLIIVGILVVGPRRLPTMMRTAGSWITKLRRITTEFRSQSGIDDLIRQEGLEREIRELRALSRVNVIETLVSPVIGAATAGSVVTATPRVKPPEPAPQPQPEPQPAPEPVVQPLREREYPVLGCDSYGAEIELEPANQPAGAAGDLAKPEHASAAGDPAKPEVAHAGEPGAALKTEAGGEPRHGVAPAGGGAAS